jgi:geranylgeranyl pyrophosphate synthase
MDLYTQTVDFLLGKPIVENWPDMQFIIDRNGARKPSEWKLPLLSCEAVGGQLAQAIPAIAALACMQISIILIDDMLDDDPRGDYHQLGMPVAANLAIAFQATGLEVIANSQVQEEVKAAVLQNLNRMMLTTALGQHLDVQNPTDEKTYWKLVRTKSSPFFGTALCIGALMGNGTVETASLFNQFGELYGEMIQIYDDLHDTMAVPANPDWILGRSSLPILYAQVVNHKDKERFLKLHQKIADPAALKEAQTILVRCGAISYCVDQILYRHQAGKKILDSIPIQDKGEFEELLDDVIKPVESLFNTLDLQIPPTLL